MTPLFLALTFVLLNALDVGLTLIVLAAGGLEGNPLPAHIGWPAFAAIKVAVAVGVGALAYWKHGQPAVIANIFLMAGVVIWNAVILWITLGGLE
jgi:hypothetical protein